MLQNIPIQPSQISDMDNEMDKDIKMEMDMDNEMDVDIDMDMHMDKSKKLLLRDEWLLSCMNTKQYT